MSTDDRNGLPSASGMERISLCPGSFGVSQWVPENLRPSTSIYAQSGSAIAEMVEGMFHQKFEEDNDEHLKWAMLVATRLSQEYGILSYDDCVSMVREAIRMIKATKMAWERLSTIPLYDSTNLLFSERRIWKTGRSYNPKISGNYSAKPDLVVFNQRHRIALVLDFKSGWLPVKPASENHQIRSTIGLLYSMFDGGPGSTTIPSANWDYHGAIIQPNAPGTLSMASFSSADAIKFANHYQKIAKEAVDLPDPQNHLTPSKDACKYCDARLVCPAVNTLAKQVAYGQFTPTSIKHALEIGEVLDIYSDGWKTKAKELLANDPTAIPGYGLEKSGMTTKVVDPVGAYESVKDLVQPDQFMGVCSVPIGKLTDVFAKASKLPKTKARDALMGRLGFTVKQEEKAPKLVRTDILIPEHES